MNSELKIVFSSRLHFPLTQPPLLRHSLFVHWSPGLLADGLTKTTTSFHLGVKLQSSKQRCRHGQNCLQIMEEHDTGRLVLSILLDVKENRSFS